jgi:hypothetical protein
MKKEIIHEIESELKVTQESILKAYPSIYSKQDVLQMLNGFVENITRWVTELPEEKTEAQSNFLTEERRMDLAERLNAKIERVVDRLEGEEIVDFSSASFSIGYNNVVEIDSIDTTTYNITEAIDNCIIEVLGDFFPVTEEEPLDTPYATEQ